MGQLLPRKESKGASDLAGKYRLIAELGQGGMATVYLAVVMGNSGFRKLAVVKLLRPEFAVDEEFIQMFLDEARLCARLNHPNIVHTYDVGVDESGHLIAMEYLDGVSLHAATARLARNNGPFSFPLQARVLLEVIEGLRYAHELKDYDGRSLEIVHRDVTPHNIFVTYDGTVKLLDFGIAKAATSSVKTATGVIKGKLTYMAPEQARGDHVDARADLYAVGVMLWEAITGRRRWPTGLTEPALFTRLAMGELPETPNAAAKGYPAEIDAIVMKSLAPNPDERYQTAAEFRDALDAVVRQLPVVSLRDLGGLMASSFGEDRNRIRHVIEEQFRAIEAGAPSDPHQLPAVPHPSTLTASESIERKPLSNDRPAENIVESQSRRITAPAPVAVSIKAPLWRSPGVVAVGSVVIVTAIAVGIVLPRLRGIHETRPAASDVPPVLPTPNHESQLAHETAPVVEATRDPRPQDPGETTAESTAHSSSPHHGESAHHTPYVGPIHNEPAHAAPSATATQSIPAPTATATAQSPADDPLVHSTPGRPKVQLERDNPWP